MIIKKRRQRLRGAQEKCDDNFSQMFMKIDTTSKSDKTTNDVWFHYATIHRIKFILFLSKLWMITLLVFWVSPLDIMEPKKSKTCIFFYIRLCSFHWALYCLLLVGLWLHRRRLNSEEFQLAFIFFLILFIIFIFFFHSHSQARL